MTTATLQHWPARLVPPPRERIGAPCSRHASTAATTSSTSAGRRRRSAPGGSSSRRCVEGAAPGVEADLAARRCAASSRCERRARRRPSSRRSHAACARRDRARHRMPGRAVSHGTPAGATRRTILAACLTCRSSGSPLSLTSKGLACSSVMCGGSGGTSGSTIASSTHRPIRGEAPRPRPRRPASGRRRGSRAARAARRSARRGSPGAPATPRTSGRPAIARCSQVTWFRSWLLSTSTISRGSVQRFQYLRS